MENKEFLYKILNELSPGALKLYLMMSVEDRWENSKENIQHYCDTFGFCRQHFYVARRELIDKGYIKLSNKRMEVLGSGK